MKYLVILLLSFMFLTVQSQNTSDAQTEKLNIQISSAKDLSNFLHQKFELSSKNIKLVETYKVESLSGTHFTFAFYKNDIRLANFYLKAHLNKNNQLFFLQHNFNKNIQFELEEKSISLDRILARIDKQIKVDKIEKVFLRNESGKYQNAIILSLYKEAVDFYVERSYFSETEFIEKDLKVHFAPADTSLNAKVFMPDPLTSSENEYGGEYQDAFSKDTSALVVKTIANLGQEGLDSGTSSFVLYGDTFAVQAILVQNTFSGDSLYFVFQNIYLNVAGDILGYNTTFTDDTTDYVTQLITEDYDFEALNNERVAVEVTGDVTAGVFSLKNTLFEIDDFSIPFVAVHTDTTNNFVFKRSHSAFEEANAFYHLNNFHDYIEQLGFENFDLELIKVDVHGAFGGDNSFFTNTPTPRLIFGDGGVDDAEDADVVIHEYTHALSYFGSPNTLDSTERRALDEALGDYFSSSYSSSFNVFNVNNVFSWDGHNEFWEGRFTNSEKTYKDYDDGNSIYSNGAIWSATLMDIFNILGRDITDKIVLESLFYNTTETKFSDAADVLLLVDSVLFAGAYNCEIYNVLVDRDFKTGKCIAGNVVDGSGLIALNTQAFSETNGTATIHIFEENLETLDYWITDALGRIIEKRKNVKASILNFDAGKFVSGLYYLRVQTNNNKYQTKLLKR